MEHFYVSEKEGDVRPVTSLDDPIFEDGLSIVHVFDGEYTCCRFGTAAICDKEK